MPTPPLRATPPPRPSRSRLATLGLALAWLAATGSAPAAPRVEVDTAGRISVDARDAAVLEVMQELSRVTGIRLVVAGEPPETRGSWEFSGLPLEQALQRLLANIDHVVAGDPGDTGPTRVTGIWLLSPQAGVPGPWPVRAPGTVPGQDTDPRFDAEPPLDADLPADDAALAVVLEQIAQLESGEDPEAVVRLGDLLASPEPAVRGALAPALARSGDPRAEQMLGQLLYGDPDPQVRRASLVALARSGHPQTEPMLRRALQDADPAVRAEVARLLDGMQTAAPVLGDPDP